MDLREEFDQLKEQIEELKILIIKEKQVVKEVENPLRIKEVAKYLTKSTATIYGYVQQKKIPHYKRGNKLWFFKTEILDWIKTGKVKTTKEIEIEVDKYFRKEYTLEAKVKGLLSPRAIGALRTGLMYFDNIDSVDEIKIKHLMKFKLKELMKFRNMGKLSRGEIKESCLKAGFTLR